MMGDKIGENVRRVLTLWKYSLLLSINAQPLSTPPPPSRSVPLTARRRYVSRTKGRIQQDVCMC